MQGASGWPGAKRIPPAFTADIADVASSLREGSKEPSPLQSGLSFDIKIAPGDGGRFWSQNFCAIFLAKGLEALLLLKVG
jgi:hypothetical protein